VQLCRPIKSCETTVAQFGSALSDRYCWVVAFVTDMLPLVLYGHSMDWKDEGLYTYLRLHCSFAA
jgi:hypothetical protein